MANQMTLDEAIEHAREVAKRQEEDAAYYNTSRGDEKKSVSCKQCAEEHRQLARWLSELRVFKSRKGEWLRMSDLSEQEDDRYQCSYCRNVVHYKDKMDLYTFNKWCGRCGSDNVRKIEVEL